MRMAPVTMVLMGLAVPALTGCFSGLSSKLPAQQRYVLQPRLAAPAAQASAPAGSVVVLRPSAAAGLGGDGIAVLRPGARLDYYSDARWAGDAPSTLQSDLIADHGGRLSADSGRDLLRHLCAGRIDALMFTVAAFRDDSRQLKGVPWWRNYRVQAVLLLAVTACIVVIFR